MPTPPVGSRAARRRSCSAKPSRGEKHNSVPAIPPRLGRSTTLLWSCSSRESLMRPGGGLWAEQSQRERLGCCLVPHYSWIVIFGWFIAMKRCDKWFIYAFFIIAEGFFVYICICCCFPHLLTMCPPSAKTHESIVTLYHTAKEFIKPEEFSRLAIPERNCVAYEVTNRIVLPTQFNEDHWNVVVFQGALYNRSLIYIGLLKHLMWIRGQFWSICFAFQMLYINRLATSSDCPGTQIARGILSLHMAKSHIERSCEMRNLRKSKSMNMIRHVKVVWGKSSKHWTRHGWPKKGANRYRPSVPNDIWSF